MAVVLAALALAAAEPGANCDSSAPLDCGSWALAGPNSSTVIASLQTPARYLVCARLGRPDQGYSKRVAIYVDSVASEGSMGDRAILGTGACVILTAKHIQVAAIDPFVGLIAGVYRRLEEPLLKQLVRWTSLYTSDQNVKESVLLFQVDKPQVARVCVGEFNTKDDVMPPVADPQSGRSVIINVDGFPVYSAPSRTPSRIIGGSCADVEGSKVAVAPSAPGKPELTQAAGLLAY